MDSPEQMSISDACSEVIESYQQCLQKQDIHQQYQLIKTEYDRLKIWAGNIGVYTHSPAAADDRLRENDELRNLVIRLLIDTSCHLRKYIRVDKGGDYPEHLTSSEDSSELSDGEVQPRRMQNAYARLLHRLVRANSRLFSVLTLVRQPTYLTSNEKVFRFDFEKQLNADDYKNLIADFEKYIDFYLNHTFRSLEVPSASSLDRRIFERLKKGAILRRKALILKQRHKRKLNANVNTKFKAQPYQFQDVAISENKNTQQEARRSASFTAVNRPGSIELSGTVPSVVAKPVLVKAEEPKPQSAPKSSKSRILLRGKLDIPRLPQSQEHVPETNCYICGLTLDTSSLSLDRWRKHVLEDIDAFVCLFQCDKPDLLYKTPETWYEHMQTHRMRWGCMLPAHTHMIFDSETELEVHLRSEHSSKLSQSQIQMLSRRGQRPLSAIFETCPICGRTDTELQDENDAMRNSSSMSQAEKGHIMTNALQRHIERHMYELALLSILPDDEATPMSDSVAVNEDFKVIMDDQIGIRLREEGLGSLPRGDDAALQAQPPNLEFVTAVAKDQIQARFFDEGPEAAIDEWSKFLDGQVPPPDISDRLDMWQRSCRQIQISKDLTQRRDDRWLRADAILIGDLQAGNNNRSMCAANAEISLFVNEGLCTNLEILNMLRDFIDPVDIAIVPPIINDERLVTIRFLTVEDAESAFVTLNGFTIEGVTLPIKMGHPSTVSARPAVSRQLTSSADREVVQHPGAKNPILSEPGPATQAQQLPYRVRTWLQAPDAPEDFITMRSSATPGTGSWFLKQPVFQKWLERDNSLMWLHSFIGFGKSVLCSKIIEYALQLQEKQDKTAVAFFFFRSYDQTKQDHRALLRALLAQFAGQSRSLVVELMSMAMAAEFSFVSDKMVLKLLKQAIQEFQHVYIVLDGLDECSAGKSRNAVVDVISSMREWALPCLHLLVSSRTLAEIRDALQVTEAQETFRLTNSLTEDLALYAEVSLETDVVLKRLEAPTTDIKTWLTYRPQGCMLLARSLLLGLREVALAKGDIERFVGHPPSILASSADVYEKMLLRIPDDLQNPARYILSFLCFAQRRYVHLDEVNDLLQINQYAHSDIPEYKLTSPSELWHFLAGLIELIQIDTLAPVVHAEDRFLGDNEAQGDEQAASLAHFTICDYLMSDQITLGPARIFALSKTTSHADLCRISLTCLNQDNLDVKHTTLPHIRHPFILYAASNWTEHFKGAGAEITQDHIALAYKLCTTAVLFTRLVMLHNVEKPNEIDRSKPSSNIYYLALCGVDEVLTEVLRRSSSNINVEGGSHGTALQAATVKRYSETVRLLITYGADINARGREYDTALQAASAINCPEIMEILLDHGADVNLQGGIHGSALRAAMQNDFDRPFQMLLDKGAEMSTINGRYGYTELFWASKGGHIASLRSIIMAGAHVEWTNDDGRTPLSCASQHGRVAVVQMLLNVDAKPDTKDKDGRTPLSLAAGGGHEGVIRLLLDQDVDRNSRDFFGITPLHWAAVNGHTSIVHTLLEHGAYINSKNSTGRTPLSWASAYGHLAVTQLLLDNGADIDQADNEYGDTPLSWAISENSSAVATLLVECGAQVNRQNFSGLTPLHQATLRGRADIAKLLIVHGAEVNVMNKLGETALIMACNNSYKDVVQLLLEAGADINLGRGGANTPPLYGALLAGDPEILQLLLDAGAAVDTTDPRYRSALKLTPKTGREEVFRILRNVADADPSVLDSLTLDDTESDDKLIHQD